MLVDLHIAYMLMLVSITLTLMPGHSGSAKAKQIHVECSRQLSKQQLSIKLVTTLGHVYVTLTLHTFIWLDHLAIYL